MRKTWEGTAVTATHSRRDILRGALGQRRISVMRPPGAQPDFERLCIDCDDCAVACPEAIIINAKSGGPALDFNLGVCTFCGDCARACPTGALLQDDQTDWPWQAEIEDKCLSFQGISCRACEDACDARALRFRLETGGRAVPVLDADKCTGCGECAFTCPAGAVAFTRRPPAKMEKTA